jgi:hypothetical protein
MAKGFLTYSTTVILQAIANGYLHGFDIIDITGMPGGTVYPALRRLDEAGYLVRMGEAEHRAVGTAPAAQANQELAARGARCWPTRSRHRLVDQAQPSERRAPRASAPEGPPVALRPHLRLIALVGLIVPRHLRRDWRQGMGDRAQASRTAARRRGPADRRHKVELFRRSSVPSGMRCGCRRRDWRPTCFRICATADRCWSPIPVSLRSPSTLALGIGAEHGDLHSPGQARSARCAGREQPQQLVAFVSDASAEPGDLSAPEVCQLSDPQRRALRAGRLRPAALHGERRDHDRARDREIVSPATTFDVLGVRLPPDASSCPRRIALPICTPWW